MIDKLKFEQQKFESYGICQRVAEAGTMRVSEGWEPTPEKEIIELRDYFIAQNSDTKKQEIA